MVASQVITVALSQVLRLSFFFKEGIQEPSLAVAMALAFIVVLDATSLRKQVENHAKALNVLNSQISKTKLRERIAHTRIEVLAGLLTGVMAAWIVHSSYVAYS
ncbi:divergent PAP2 family protein [Vibrio mexicanus]|uniref:divergent PAP2 family protein n=1 Tax=Vibrio mexicanus TaxID=1004326 RepID=UPI002351D6D1|nr:divergent PAP2 family protein [Vibrio mexicanus]